MATTYYSMIFVLPNSELPDAFEDFKAVYDFIGVHYDHDLKLHSRSRHGAVFAELERRVEQFGLESLLWVHPFVRFDQEIDRSYTIKRIPSEQYAPICRDIDALIASARSSPRLFDISSSDAAVEKEMYEWFSEEANSDEVSADLTHYDEDATWSLLFAFLRTVRSVCTMAISDDKAVLHVCIWG